MRRLRSLLATGLLALQAPAAPAQDAACAVNIAASKAVKVGQYLPEVTEMLGCEGTLRVVDGKRIVGWGISDHPTWTLSVNLDDDDRITTVARFFFDTGKRKPEQINAKQATALPFGQTADRHG